MIAPRKFGIDFINGWLVFDFRENQNFSMLVCDKVNGMKTPIKYSGISRSIFPPKMIRRKIAPAAKVIIPLLSESRSPRAKYACGMKRSRAIVMLTIGKSENPVLTATTRISAVANW